jgi:hypothetical protein
MCSSSSDDLLHASQVTKHRTQACKQLVSFESFRMQCLALALAAIVHARHTAATAEPAPAMFRLAAAA